jgi:hypothetical protein
MCYHLEETTYVGIPNPPPLVSLAITDIKNTIPTIIKG